MAEKPILFSAPMVRAILAGRKTQTRRVMKLTDSGRVKIGAKQWPPDDTNAVEGCPVSPGDVLWVRETWKPDPSWGRGKIPTPQLSPGDNMLYRASLSEEHPKFPWCPWRPSIHMPRWAARIFLEVTGVRIERLNDISEEDAYAEGATPIECSRESLIFGTQKARYRFRDGFRDLWESINGPGSWAENPWVWVYTFKKLEGKNNG